MKIDIDCILFWMDAIRDSEDRFRTLESFWKGQVKSKLWLIENLKRFVNDDEVNVVIHGGWNGVLASLLFQSPIKIKNCISIDIDPNCQSTAATMNKIEEMAGRFQSITCDMTKFDYTFYPDIVINTSCEHISQKDYENWLDKIPKRSLIVLQSNNYFDLQEHIRCAKNLEDFKNQSKLKTLFTDELELLKYNRYMIVGYKP